MAGEFSNVGAEIGLNVVCGRDAGPGARTMYLAALTAAPTDATTLATMAELSVAGYARQAVTWAAPAGDPRSIANTAIITFGPFTADPAEVTHLALVSASSGTVGDLVMHWALDTSRDPAINDSLQVAVGALTMSLD